MLHQQEHHTDSLSWRENPRQKSKLFGKAQQEGEEGRKWERGRSGGEEDKRRRESGKEEEEEVQGGGGMTGRRRTQRGEAHSSLSVCSSLGGAGPAGRGGGRVPKRDRTSLQLQQLRMG